MHVIGLDIGGANLKAADLDGAAVSRSFALWREPQRLAAELSSLLQTVGQAFQPDASQIQRFLQLRVRLESLTYKRRLGAAPDNGGLSCTTRVTAEPASR